MNKKKKLDTHGSPAFDQQLFLIYSSLRGLLGMYGKLLKNFDLTYTQYLILSCLQEKKNLLMNEVSDKIYLDSGTLTPVIKTLETKRLVKKIGMPGDKRQRLLSLTQKGAALIFQINSEIHPILQKFYLKKQELEVLKNMLNNIKKSEKVINAYMKKAS